MADERMSSQPGYTGDESDMPMCGRGAMLRPWVDSRLGTNLEPFHRFRTMPSVASGRALILSMLVLVVCDVIGGFLAVASGVDTWDE